MFFPSLSGAAQATAEGKPTPQPVARSEGPRTISRPGGSADASAKPSAPPYLIEPPDILRLRIEGPVKLPEPLPEEHLVRSDGTIRLGSRDALFVTGMTVDQIESVLASWLKIRFNNDLPLDQIKPSVHVEVIAYNANKHHRPMTPKRAMELPVEAQQGKQYHVECTLVKVDARGQDFGPLGKGNVLAKPLLLLLEGQEGRLHMGDPSNSRGAEDTVVEFPEAGLEVRVKITGLGKDGLRMETALERTELERAHQQGVRVRGRSVRSVDRVKPGAR